MSIKVVAPYDHSGYSTAARRTLLALRDAGIPFTWTPMVPGTGWDLTYEPFHGNAVGDPDLDPYCNRAIAYDTVVVQLVPEYLLRWRLAEPDKRLVAATVWETDRLPHHWRFFLELADLVLVPCAWNQGVFERADLRVPVAVFPHLPPRVPAVVETAVPWPITAGDFVFYTIEKWGARKAMAELVRCYSDTFSAADAVTLIVKTSRDDLTRPRTLGGHHRTRSVVRRLRRRYRAAARILLLTDELPTAAIAGLHARGDCYVSLTHGEGFGLGVFDAACHGKPVITTAFGAPAEYLPPEDAWLVNARMVAVEDDLGRPSFARDQRWAEADTAHASTLLRHAYEHRADGARRGARLRDALRTRFDERALVARFLELAAGGARDEASIASTP